MQRVHVVMGGPSAEHDISLKSGVSVCANLDRDRFQPAAVVIDRERRFFICRDCDALTEEECGDPAGSSRFAGPCDAADSAAIWQTCDVAFLALHGEFGEDGRIQGFLETQGVPYTGSGVYASAVALNKITSKLIYERHGLATPPYSIVRCSDSPDAGRLAARHGLPLFIKCPQSGSSRLMGRAASEQELHGLLKELQPKAPMLLVETAISGIEFSCAVLESKDGSTQWLPPVEIRPRTATFFDFGAKYTSDATDELVPAPRPDNLLDRIGQTARTAHSILECSGISRTDMLYADDTLFVLETNTLPGLTEHSLLPKTFRAAGGTYPELLSRLIVTARSGS